VARLNNSARWEIGIKSRQDQLSNRHAHDLVSMIVIAVAAALDHAHKQGLLHRDVKPASITLTHVDDEEDRRMLTGKNPLRKSG
jgi:serine/threonine protein kinase